MTEAMRFDLVSDSKGMWWDLLLYVPTVIALASISVSLWYGDEHNASYLFFFLTCFFSIAGFNRIFNTRLMLLPSSPVSFSVEKNSLLIMLKSGKPVNLANKLKYFPDYAGKSFGISGEDRAGKQLQFVFHKGQFSAPDKFESAQAALKRNLK